MSGARPLLAWALATATVVSACGSDRAAPPTGQQVALGGDVVARVGSEIIPRNLVAEVAAAQQLTPAEAARRLVDDAVAATGARARGLDHEQPARWLLVAALGRIAADRLLADARAGGPPTDDEVRKLSDAHWVEVDRPPAVHVVHALVKRPSPEAADKLAQARALAAKLREALVPTQDAQAFTAVAKELGGSSAATAHGLEVVVETLPAFTEDGWVTEGQGRMVEAFARAAHALGESGATSGIVETQFGLHVIRLLDRVPEQRMPFESRRLAFAEEVVTLRARAAYEARLSALRARTPIEVLPSSEALTRELHGPERRP